MKIPSYYFSKVEVDFIREWAERIDGSNVYMKETKKEIFGEERMMAFTLITREEGRLTHYTLTKGTDTYGYVTFYVTKSVDDVSSLYATADQFSLLPMLTIFQEKYEESI